MIIHIISKNRLIIEVDENFKQKKKKFINFSIKKKIVIG